MLTMNLYSLKMEKNDSKYNLDITYLINYVPNTTYYSLIEKLKQIDYNLFKKISQIK